MCFDLWGDGVVSGVIAVLTAVVVVVGKSVVGCRFLIVMWMLLDLMTLEQRKRTRS